MPIYRMTPLAPAYVLLIGAALILIVGPALAPHRRHGLAMAISALAALSLFFAGNGYPADVELARVPWAAGASVSAPLAGVGQGGLIEWLGTPALAVRVAPFEPFVWVLMLSLLAISAAERGVVNQLSPLDQAMLFVLTAVACGVVLAGTYSTLAFTLLLFDGTAALFALAAHRPGRAVARLFLGVLSSTAIVVLAQGTDHATVHPVELGTLFCLTTWLRLGLYPLVESGVLLGSLPPMRLGWSVVNLLVGLYLVPASGAPWLTWLIGATAVLHGVLAWLEPSREGTLAHAAHALAGAILMMAAAVGDGPGTVAASISTLAALVALGLTAPQLGRPEATRLHHLWAYLPPLLATASLVGVPFTLGWEGRGALYQAAWESGAPGVLALAVIAEGAALSVMYRYWRRLLHGLPTESQPVPELETQAPKPEDIPQSESQVWRPLGATLACIPFLVPVLGARLLLTMLPSASPSATLSTFPLSAWWGLGGSLLWAFFLGYGRRRLLASLPTSRQTLMGALRVGWLLRNLGYALDAVGRVLLRMRAVIEGEHYLGWAILLALGLGLAILLR
ncbi:MAG: hypothetical protein JSV81_01300 [Anaerolineales bacterium]|nr:MAG: hypothetical protein JSV81_01300 [Anaerolineales bacterium]